MTFPTRYLRPLIASVFGLAFLAAAPRFAAVVSNAPKSTMVEWASTPPAALFPVVGAGLFIWAAIYAIYVTSNARY